MDVFCITGGRRLSGSVRVDGSKNAALPILAAALAIQGSVELDDVPLLQDVQTMLQLLQSLEVDVQRSADGRLILNTGTDIRTAAPWELVRQMRASVCVLGPLLSRFGSARVALPGGCRIGHRPIDLHLRGLAALGADLRMERGDVIATATRLRGADIDLTGPCGSTVTGTCNVMVAAATARGITRIRGAAREPEVVDLGAFLNAAGAQISGLGTSMLEIHGVEGLSTVRHAVIPDRIEAATLAMAAAVTGGCVQIENAPMGHMTAVLETLRELGVDIGKPASGDESAHGQGETLQVRGGSLSRTACLTTAPYPGLPTDTQAQLTALLALVPGRSRVTDQVFPDRFLHIAELNRMGAQIQMQGHTAVIDGISRYSAAPVTASDLRASAALVLAALAADGTTEIRQVHHLDRGYLRFEEKLNLLGANVHRRTESPLPPPHFHSAGTPSTPIAAT